MRRSLLTTLASSVLTLAALGVAGACGSSSNGAGPGSQAEAGTDASGDTGGGDVATDTAVDSGHVVEAEAGPAYPAFAIDVPQIVKNQGTVLTAPVIVTITWPADTAAATWEAFDDGIGASSYWTATTAEYGVGTATSAAADHVHMMQPLPASISYTDLQNLVTASLTRALDPDAGAPAPDSGAPDPVWPAPTLDSKGNAQTIYSVFIPSSTAVTDPGSGAAFCAYGATGYHATVSVGTLTLVYSVTLECPGMGNDGIEETAAHETVESATDPYGYTGNDGYHGYDPDHLAWDLYTGFNDELSDACEAWQYAYVQETGSFPYWVQLSWSNQAVKAGHDPCVPAAAGPYQGMTIFPKEQSAVTVDLSSAGMGMLPTRGYAVTVGKPLTFHVGFYSDAPAAPWKIGYDFPATIQAGFTPIGNGTATVTLGKTSGQNGDETTVTVTPTKKGDAGFQVMAITWDPPTSSGFLPRYLPVVLADH